MGSRKLQAKPDWRPTSTQNHSFATDARRKSRERFASDSASGPERFNSSKGLLDKSDEVATQLKNRRRKKKGKAISNDSVNKRTGENKRVPPPTDTSSAEDG